MEVKPLSAPRYQEEPHAPNPVMGLVYIVIVITWVLIFIVGMALSLGGWAAWWSIIGLGICAAVILGVMQFNTHWKAHQLHTQELKNQEHHRAMTELAIQRDHSAEHISATSSFRAMSKYAHTNLTIKDVTMGANNEQKQIEPPHVEQPRLETIIEQLTDNALEVPFGLSRETGQLVTSKLTQAVHLSSVGDSGGGKSRGAQGILTALAAKNDTAHLQLAFIDAESETTLPFQHLPQVGYLAEDPRDAAQVLAELVRIKRQRDITKVTLPFILLFVEEFLVLKQRIPSSMQTQALDDFTELACTGRKRNLALYTIGQTGYSDKRIRDAQAQFQTLMGYPIHPRRAQSAGFLEYEKIKQLYQEKRHGQFVLEHKGDNAIILAPYVDAQIVSNILVPEAVPGEFQDGEQPLPKEHYLISMRDVEKPPELDLNILAVVREMVSQEKSQNEIIAASFLKMRHSDAIAEYRKYLSYLVRKAE